jgi:hypothetical protein
MIKLHFYLLERGVQAEEDIMKDGANVQDDVLKVWVGGEDTLPQLFW